MKKNYEKKIIIIRKFYDNFLYVYYGFMLGKLDGQTKVKQEIF